jgi:hypothetical protein
MQYGPPRRDVPERFFIKKDATRRPGQKPLQSMDLFSAMYSFSLLDDTRGLHAVQDNSLASKSGGKKTLRYCPKRLQRLQFSARS